MFVLNRGDKIGIVACSDALPRGEEGKIQQLSDKLTALGFIPVYSNCIFSDENAICSNAPVRANTLLNFYADHTIKAIFDISGGNISNEILPLLDYTLIQNHPKPFFGYSDLTTVINAMFTMTGNASCLFQLKTLVWENGERQTQNFKRSVIEGKKDLYDIKWDFIQGSHTEGVLIGGNLRCLLKLAGTPYMPDFSNKVLFLESLGGGAGEITTYFNQLKQMGVFQKIAGLLLGTFTRYEAQVAPFVVAEHIKQIVNSPFLPIAKTQQVGHGNTAKCIIIGSYYHCAAE